MEFRTALDVEFPLTATTAQRPYNGNTAENVEIEYEVSNAAV